MKLFSRHKSGDQIIDRLREDLQKKRDKVEALPRVLYLEATAVCNLRCPMCPTTIGLPREPYRAKIFEMSLLDKLSAVLPSVRRVFLSGGGEPFLHPRFFDLVRAVKRHSAEVHFNCNATLLDEDRARAAVESGVDTISFSFDGATPETYSRIRVGADFDRVIANIRRLSEIKKASGSERPFLNMQFTLLDLNAPEVERMPEVAARAGIHHLVVEPLTPVYNFDAEYKSYYEAHVVRPEAIREKILLAEKRARELGLVFSSHYLAAESGPRVCFQPWLTLGVRVDGRVFTCCGTIEVMGDLATQSFEEIWNGEKYRSLRRTLLAGSFPGFCQNCISENRANHFNEDLLPGKS